MNQIKPEDDVIHNHLIKTSIKSCRVEMEIENEMLFNPGPRREEVLKKRLKVIRADIRKRMRDAEKFRRGKNGGSRRLG